MKNIKENKKAKTWTVTQPNGKEVIRKTHKGAVSLAERVQRKVVTPSILTANCYYWTPSSNASGRRSNEKRKQNEVSFFMGELRAYTKLSEEFLSIDFNYDESCLHVYKSVTYFVNGAKTNLTGFRNFLAKRGIILT